MVVQVMNGAAGKMREYDGFQKYLEGSLSGLWWWIGSGGPSLVAQMVKNLPAVQETQV